MDSCNYWIQIKYAALDAWASRMIALEGRAASDSTVTSLENLPEELLQLLARAITNYGILHRTEKTVFEVRSFLKFSFPFHCWEKDFGAQGRLSHSAFFDTRYSLDCGHMSTSNQFIDMESVLPLITKPV